MTTHLELEFIRAELAAIASKHGELLQPSDVVNAARSEDSILHKFFDWDDSHAAHAWRMTQARGLIRQFRYVITTETTQISSVYYIRDPDLEQGEAGYIPAQRLLGDPERCRAVLMAEFTRAASMFRRARELSQVFGMEHEIDEIFDLVDTLNKKISADVFVRPGPAPPAPPAKRRRGKGPGGPRLNS
jgi:hypothetical protein